jgi:hypothetical protein
MALNVHTVNTKVLVANLICKVAIDKFFI